MQVYIIVPLYEGQITTSIVCAGRTGYAFLRDTAYENEKETFKHLAIFKNEKAAREAAKVLRAEAKDDGSDLTFKVVSVEVV